MVDAATPLVFNERHRVQKLLRRHTHPVHARIQFDEEGKLSKLLLVEKVQEVLVRA